MFSSDGTTIAFECERDGRLAVGVVPAAGGAVTWIADGPGNAGQPAWMPDGALIYTCRHDTNTALAAFHRKAKDGGANLWRWKDGHTERLTDGRVFDYTPSAGPDGTIWFATTRGKEKGGFSDGLCAAHIAAIPSGTKRIETRLPFAQSNSGAMQPVVSPDGRVLLWAELNGFRSNWQIVAAPIGDLKSRVALTSMLSACHSPRWSPDGRRICYTGYRVGDPGWCVYVQEVATGAETRVCEGNSPCFSPDGKMLLYDRDGGLFLRPAPPVAKGLSETRTTAAVPHFVQAAVTVPESAPYRKVRTRADNLYVMSQRGTNYTDVLQLFIREGLPVFASRTSDGRPVMARGTTPVPRRKRIVFTGVRTADCVRLYADGQLIASTADSLCSLDGLCPPKIGENRSPLAIEDFRTGEGWPEGIPPPVTRESLFGREVRP